MTAWMSLKRTFVAATRWPMLASALVAGTLVASAQSSPRTPITPAMVVEAMQQRQLPVAGVSVRLSAPVTASAAEPQLEIQSITLTDSHRAQLLVGCRVHTECLPFYVAAVWPAETNLATQHIAHMASAPDATAASAGNSASSATGNDGLKPGSPATLLIDDNKLHITLRVVSLQSGAPGDTVRVVTQDRRQVFVAQLLGNGILKGSLSHE